MDRLLAALRQGQEKRDAELNKDAADAPDPTVVAARFHRGRLMLRDPVRVRVRVRARVRVRFS